ncbi:MAG: ABC transporter permease [Nitriliruptoraceae bacterium]
MSRGADGRLRTALRTSRRSGPAAIAGVVIVGAFLLVVLAGDWLAPFTATERAGIPYQPPDAVHLLGTDDVGRDLYSQLVLGARTSLAIGAGVALLSIAIGTLVGGIAGLLRGAVDTIAMRTVDVVLSLPFLPLLVVAAAFLGRGLTTQILLISALSWARPARLVRAAVLAASGRGHVQAATTLGAGTWWLLTRHLSFSVAPLLVPLVVRAAMGAILLEASLSFLGLGDPQRASWGTMLYWANVRAAVLTDAWLWWVLPPGIAIASIVVGLGLIGLAWEERLNPALAGGRGRAA